MRLTMQLAMLALLFFVPSSVCSGESNKETPVNKATNAQYLAKESDENWEIAIQSERGYSGKMDGYIDSAAFKEKPRMTIKSTDLIGGQLGTTEPPEGSYILVVEVRIRNLQKKKTPFFPDDISLKYEGKSEKILYRCLR